MSNVVIKNSKFSWVWIRNFLHFTYIKIIIYTYYTLPTFSKNTDTLSKIATSIMIKFVTVLFNASCLSKFILIYFELYISSFFSFYFLNFDVVLLQGKLLISFFFRRMLITTILFLFSIIIISKVKKTKSQFS